MGTTSNTQRIRLGMRIVDTADFAAASLVFRGEWGQRFAEWIMRLLSIDQVNRVHMQYGKFKGAAFTARLLNDIGVHYRIGNAERLENLPEGAFITVSNHPYGGLDGIMAIDLFGQLRPDYKFMVNQLLARITALEGSFIPVTPTGNRKKGITAASIRGIRETIEHLQNGHPVGFFPSGAVSDFRLTQLRVRDRSWQKSILHLLHSAKVPILPIRFFDQNSMFFYVLGLLNWRIRLLRLPVEVFNKKGQQPRIAIGNIITPEEQKQLSDPGTLGRFLRKSIYEMPLPHTFTEGRSVIRTLQGPNALTTN